MTLRDVSLNQPAAGPQEWLLDPGIIFLNHGAFGACPRRVLEFQGEWRARLEHRPLQFLVRELEKELDAARETLAQFTGTDADDLVFVPNATSGVNSILRALEFRPGDELLVTDHEYNACRNALDFVAGRSGARVVVAKIPFPFRRADEMVAPILECVTERTKLRSWIRSRARPESFCPSQKSWRNWARAAWTRWWTARTRREWFR